MAESVVSFVVETIGKLLIDEAKLLWGVEGKVKDLQKELKLIKCLLRDADAKREHDLCVAEWVKQLRDIAYDAEDVIERYILRVAPKMGLNIIKTCLQVHVVGIEIEGLKSRLCNHRISMESYGVRPVTEAECKRTSTSMPKWCSDDYEEHFVGREDSLKVLVKQLLTDETRNKVIFIQGMGGLGKTTLARKVLTLDIVKINFDGFAWANISKKYHTKDILVGILVKLIPDQKKRVMKMKDDELFETLYKIQQEKRCIVVLDNIWTIQAWDSLRAAFPIEKTRSKLLITTRDRDIAKHIDPQGLFHEPQFLSNQESWDLLKKRAFPKTKVSPVITEGMERLGDELLRKCGGLPLVIIVIGGLLAVNEWETVYRKIKSYFSDLGDVSKVLALSYDDLPWHVKQCFLYLSSFPEDAEIPVMEVLHMWIVEGFVSLNAYDEDREITMEDIAKTYLMELVNRGLVQVQFNLSGKIKNCHLHDLMRDLCIHKASQEEFLGFLNIPQDNETGTRSSLMAIESNRKVQRLSLNLHLSAERSMIPIIEQIGRTIFQLRTLIFKSIRGKWNQFQPIFINCKLLRVLKFEDLYFMRGNLPESVGDLFHLRFLSLKGSDFEGLPQSMGNLVCMEFLDLRVDSNVVVTVPNVLWKMRRLRHLHLPYHFVVKEKFCGNRKKLQLDTLKNLQTLRNFGSSNCDVNDVGKLTNMRKLTILEQHGSDELEIIQELAKFNLRRLQTSSFRFSSLSFIERDLSKMSSYPYLCKLFLRGKIEKLSEHKYLPPHLRKLVLVYSYLKEDPMSVLGKLHSLVVLMLGFSAFVGEEMVCSAGGFPQLKHLVLDGLPNLEEWRVAEGAMPHLSRLGISKCPKLKAVPELEGVSTYDGCGHMADEYWK